jgi:hypothetical protein
MSAYQQLPKEEDTEGARNENKAEFPQTSDAEPKQTSKVGKLDDQKPEIAADCLEISTEEPLGDGVGSEWNESDVEISKHEPLLVENECVIFPYFGKLERC